MVVSLLVPAKRAPLFGTGVGWVMSEGGSEGLVSIVSGFGAVQVSFGAKD